MVKVFGLVTSLGEEGQDATFPKRFHENGLRRYTDDMTVSSPKRKVIWQFADGELQKWEQRPLHKGKKNYWWSFGSGGWLWADMEVRAIEANPERGFFASITEALECFLTFHTKRFAITEESVLDWLLKRLVSRRTVLLDGVKRINTEGWHGSCPYEHFLDWRDFEIESLTEQIAAVIKRQASLQGTVC
jgi:hypothetical protein